jgi:hypothetical protein
VSVSAVPTLAKPTTTIGDAPAEQRILPFAPTLSRAEP